MNRTVPIMAVATLALAACTTGALPVERSSGLWGSSARPAVAAVGALTSFDACDELLDWVRHRALDMVGPYGLSGGYPPGMFVEEVEGDLVAPATGTLDAAVGAERLAEDVTTNLQEVGIDEPDFVKSDGHRIVVASGDQISVLLIEKDRLVLAGSVRLGFGSQAIFLDGDRVIAISSGGYWPMPFDTPGVAADSLYPTQPVTTIAHVDISDPSDPSVFRTLRIDGRFVSGRGTAGTIRLVIASGPTGFAWSYPEGGGLRSEREAEAANRLLVERSEIANWLPYYIVTDHTGIDRVVEEGTLGACDRVHHPDEFSGISTLSVITLTDGDLSPADTTSLFSDGDTVYASAAAVYVATTAWTDPNLLERDGLPDGVATQIHKFGLLPERAEYQASGTVPGYLLSQWSMSEWQGDLRVASTTAPAWWDGPDSESVVTVLRERDDVLETVGKVGDLGKGERIYAVRFIEDRGYVVTFRQVDPLYVVDLSEPEAPVVRGELKIPGYSAYLHPVDGGYLLGVGQDADADGRVRGTQASLFDIADPGHPERIDRLTLRDAHSEVEWDHHAFLHVAATGLTVFPFQRWDEAGGKTETGAIVLTVGRNGIERIGTIGHGNSEADWSPPVRRAMFLGGRLVTVSDAGVMLTDATTLDELDWTALGR